MNLDTIHRLVCSECRSSAWTLEIYVGREGWCEEGRLICQSCRCWYRVEAGIVDLLPGPLRRQDLYADFARAHAIPREETSGGAVKVAHRQVKTRQIEFFRRAAEYEREVVQNPYYQALDSVVFLEWVRRSLLPGTVVLDVGGGTGRQAFPLAQHGVHTIVVDISEEMLRVAREKVREAGLDSMVDLVVGDGEDPPLKNGSVDACIFYGTLHHLPRPQAAIAATAEKVRPGGLYYSLDPHGSPVRFLFDVLMRLWRLYDEEASGNPHIRARDLLAWTSAAGIRAAVKFSTFLPPHVFMFGGAGGNAAMLRATDALFGRLPAIRTMAGVIICEGVKRSQPIVPVRH